ncbi:MAG: tripartite tricarboxylate transporter TctB family protein [Chloroflexota bacterium]
MNLRMNRDRVLNLVVYAALLVLTLSFVIGARAYEGRMTLVPRVIGIPTALLLAFIIVAELSPRLRGLTHGRGGAADDEAPSPEESAQRQRESGAGVDAGSWQRVLTVYGWLVGFFLLTLVVGFYVAVPIFLFAFLVRESQVAPVRAAVVTVVVLLLFLLIFDLVLDLALWRGLLPRILPGYIGGGSLPPLYRGL